MDTELRQQLRSLQATGTGIKAVSQFIASHTDSAVAIAAEWRAQFERSDCQAEVLFRLANLVLTGDSAAPFIPAFAEVMEDAVNAACPHLSSIDKLQDYIRVWQSESIFGPARGERLLRSLDHEFRLHQLRELFPEREEAELQRALAEGKTVDKASDLLYNNSLAALTVEPEPAPPVWDDDEDADASTEHSPALSHGLIPIKQSRMAKHHHNHHKPHRWTKKVTSPQPPLPTAAKAQTSEHHMTEAEYAQFLEKRVAELEALVTHQQGELQRLRKNEEKLDAFVVELQKEFQKFDMRVSGFSGDTPSTSDQSSAET